MRRIVLGWMVAVLASGAGLAQTQGKMIFEVASVKQNKTMDPPNGNVDMSPGNGAAPVSGLFSMTNMRFLIYLKYAYNLTESQLAVARTGLPDWVFEDKFDVQAKVEGSPTKDQMRGMLRELLAERFKMKAHTEMREVPVYALHVARAGRLGRNLKAHVAGAPCGTDGAVKLPVGFPCGRLGEVMPEAAMRFHVSFGGQDVPLKDLANAMPGRWHFDRPVVDATGLTGNYDLLMQFSYEHEGAGGDTRQGDMSGPAFQEAVEDQLGLTLVPEKAQMEFVLIDHIEPPTAN